MVAEAERMKILAEFLNKKYLEWQSKRGRPLSQNEWCKYLGVPNTSYSQWVNELRLPVGQNVNKLANKLGPEVYDICGVQRAIPDDALFTELGDLWYAGKITEYKKKLILDIANRSTEENDISEVQAHQQI